VTPDAERLAALTEEHGPKDRQHEMTQIFEQMERYHPSDPCWYLPLIGVDPAHQGRGCGSALLQYALARCDRDGIPAYLESSNPRNISLYLRHGFEIMGHIQAGSSPTMVPMLRRPRA
jgi:GNAT superfamily N-acetyltransferase